jgi:P27 family predicted phage terminase small subunit
MPAHKKSVALKLLRGTERPDRRPKRDFSARLTRAPSPPSHLSELAAAEWRRLAPVSVSLGTLTAADMRGFELLCETLASETAARAALAREGVTVRTVGGGLKPHPSVRVLETARAQAARLLDSFGLTPRGRQSLDTPPPLPHSAADKYLLR